MQTSHYKHIVLEHGIYYKKLWLVFAGSHVLFISSLGPFPSRVWYMLVMSHMNVSGFFLRLLMNVLALSKFIALRVGLAWQCATSLLFSQQCDNLDTNMSVSKACPSFFSLPIFWFAGGLFLLFAHYEMMRCLMSSAWNEHTKSDVSIGHLLFCYLFKFLKG